MLAERTSLMAKFTPYSIDTSAVKYYFKSLRNASDNEDRFLESISLIVEIIINEHEQSADDPLKQL